VHRVAAVGDEVHWGHSDLLGGVATTKDAALWHALKKSRELTGATPGALECFLAVRGVRTMALRLHRSQQSAMVIADRLEGHPMVELTRYPGLPSHPTHATAKRVLKGFGTIISFDVRGGAAVADAAASASGLSGTPPAWARSNRPWNAGRPFQGRSIYADTACLSVGIEDVDDL